MIYRVAVADDLLQLARMRWDFRQESGDETPVVDRAEFIEICLRFLRSEAGNYVYWIAEDDGEIVSHIFAHRLNLVPRPCRPVDAFVYLTNTYTKPAFRRKGIGRQLLQKVIGWAASEDLELLLVYPSDQSVEFYRRAGFENDNEILKLVLRNY